MIEAITTDTPNEALDLRILPWAPWGNHDLFDPHMPHPLPKRDAIDAVPIAQQISRFFVPREGVNDLLGGPRGGGVLGDVDMRRFSDFKAQLTQLAHDEGRAPGRIGPPHRADKIADIFGNRRKAQLTMLA
jgi:hypothetical protein